MKITSRDRTYVLKSQDKLFQATLNEFATYRFKEASLNRIIKTSEYNKGSFYYRFKDKLDLYFALVDDFYVTFQLHFDKGSSEETGDFILKRELFRLYDALYLCHLENSDYLLFARNLYHETDDIRNEVKLHCLKSPFDRFVARLDEYLANTRTSALESLDSVTEYELGYRLFCIRERLGSVFDEAAIEDDKKKTWEWLKTSLGYKRTELLISYPSIENDNSSEPEFSLDRLNLQEGDLLGIVGKNASGKTALVKKIYSGGIINPDKRDSLSMVIVNPEMFYASHSKLQTFMTIYMKAKSPCLSNSVEQGLKKTISRFYLDNRLYQLKKDSLTFASLVLGLGKSPQVIIVDEALEWLNDRQVRHFFGILLKFRPENSTIIVTDDKLCRMFPYVDKVAFLSRGRILVTESVAELTERFANKSIIISYVDQTGLTKSRRFPLGYPLDGEALVLLKTMKVLSVSTDSGVNCDYFPQGLEVD